MHPAYLTFTHGNFFERHTVTVKGEQDNNTDDERVTLTLSGMGVTTGTVIVEVDDDDLGLILSQTPGNGDGRLNGRLQRRTEF